MTHISALLSLSHLKRYIRVSTAKCVSPIIENCVTKTALSVRKGACIIKTRCVMHTPQIHITGHFYYLFKYLETGLSPPPPCCCSIQMFGSHNRESLSSLAMAFEALKS